MLQICAFFPISQMLFIAPQFNSHFLYIFSTGLFTNVISTIIVILSLQGWPTYSIFDSLTTVIVLMPSIHLIDQD